jgi:hypothetical protein
MGRIPISAYEHAHGIEVRRVVRQNRMHSTKPKWEEINSSKRMCKERRPGTICNGLDPNQKGIKRDAMFNP